ncbi:MAG: TIGR00282 family metallophosphoesterase [Bacteroidetes bacterium]|nr:TIGR00282 family metallophosphoesterase [Bacteroidota bacterium]
MNIGAPKSCTNFLARFVKVTSQETALFLLNILFIGDVVGTDALGMLTRLLKTFTDKYHADAVIVNGENVFEGKGINRKQADELFAAGANIITTGNHIWERWESRPLLREERRILRPLNYPRNNGGAGFAIFETKSGQKVGVLSLQGRVFLPPIDDPFNAADWALEHILRETPIVIVDMHAEATAEKQAMGYYLDGRVSAVLGTHTHVQTADERILPQGTAYISDVGMTGPYDSCVGMRTDIAIKRFTYGTPHKYETAKGDMKISGVCVEVDEATGRALRIERILYPDFERQRTYVEDAGNHTEEGVPAK